MKKSMLVIWLCAAALSAQASKFFEKAKLSETGVYYYPEHWDASQWDRDLKKIADMGFEFTHYAEFAWQQLEPEEGKFDFAWLDEAVKLAVKHNLKVIMCTPTGAPPVWLARKHPEVLIERADGTTTQHGVRKQASNSSAIFRSYCEKITEALAKRYGQNPNIIGWQLDNEPNVHEDFSPEALARFRGFLKSKYNNDISALNKAWGGAFWSQNYASFDEIIHSKAARNPHQQLDYARFCADEGASFLDVQAAVLRKYIAPSQWITTNYIPNTDNGHIGLSKNFDFCTYTRYMIPGDAGIGKTGFRVGAPLAIPYANDYFRNLPGKSYGVMELQPGQVNWGDMPLQPMPGAIRLWLWSVFAGGADFICTYRFRQPIYGYELYHAGIVGTDGVTPSRGGLEFEKYISEIKELRKYYDPLKSTAPADYEARRAAILYNWENVSAMNFQKQTTLWNAQNLIRKYYGALKSFGAPVDVISSEADWDGLSKYKFIVIPAYQMVDAGAVAKWRALAENGANLIISIRTGQKDRFDRFFEAPFGAMMQDLTGAKNEFFDVRARSAIGHVKMEAISYDWAVWGEVLTPINAEVWARHDGDFYDGAAAVTHRKLGKGSVTYVGIESDNGEIERDVLKRVYALAQTPVLDLPKGAWLEYRDGFGIAVNYNDKPANIPLPADAQALIGKNPVPTAEVLVWKLK